MRTSAACTSRLADGPMGALKQLAEAVGGSCPVHVGGRRGTPGVKQRLVKGLLAPDATAYGYRRSGTVAEASREAGASRTPRTSLLCGSPASSTSLPRPCLLVPDKAGHQAPLRLAPRWTTPARPSASVNSKSE